MGDVIRFPRYGRNTPGEDQDEPGQVVPIRSGVLSEEQFHDLGGRSGGIDWNIQFPSIRGRDEEE